MDWTAEGRIRGSNSAAACETTGTALPSSLFRQKPGPTFGGQQVGDRQMLRGQNAVHCLQRKLAPAVQEIGEMRLAKPSLPRQ